MDCENPLPEKCSDSNLVSNDPHCSYSLDGTRKGMSKMGLKNAIVVVLVFVAEVSMYRTFYVVASSTVWGGMETFMTKRSIAGFSRVKCGCTPNFTMTSRDFERKIF